MKGKSVLTRVARSLALLAMMTVPWLNGYAQSAATGIKIYYAETAGGEYQPIPDNTITGFCYTNKKCTQHYLKVVVEPEGIDASNYTLSWDIPTTTGFIKDTKTTDAQPTLKAQINDLSNQTAKGDATVTLTQTGGSTLTATVHLVRNWGANISTMSLDFDTWQAKIETLDGRDNIFVLSGKTYKVTHNANENMLEPIDWSLLSNDAGEGNHFLELEKIDDFHANVTVLRPGVFKTDEYGKDGQGKVYAEGSVLKKYAYACIYGVLPIESATVKVADKTVAKGDETVNETIIFSPGQEIDLSALPAPEVYGYADIKWELWKEDENMADFCTITPDATGLNAKATMGATHIGDNDGKQYGIKFTVSQEYVDPDKATKETPTTTNVLTFIQPIKIVKPMTGMTMATVIDGVPTEIAESSTITMGVGTDLDLLLTAKGEPGDKTITVTPATEGIVSIADATGIEDAITDKDTYADYCATEWNTSKRITGSAPGSVKITVASADGTNIVKTFTINIVEGFKPVESIAPTVAGEAPTVSTPVKVWLAQAKSIAADAGISPAGASGQGTWTITPATDAAFTPADNVPNNGTISLPGVGEYTVDFSLSQMFGTTHSFSAAWAVKVLQPVTAVTLKQIVEADEVDPAKAYTVAPGDILEFKATTTEGAEIAGVDWQIVSDIAGVAEVKDATATSAKVEVKLPGEFTLKAAAKDGQGAEATVAFQGFIPAKSVALADSTGTVIGEQGLSGFRGAELIVKALVEPADAAIDTCIWSVEGDAVEITPDGLTATVKLVKGGTAKVKATVSQSVGETSIVATADITSKVPVEKIEVTLPAKPDTPVDSSQSKDPVAAPSREPKAEDIKEGAELSWERGSSLELNFAVNDDAENQSLTVTSSAPDIIEVVAIKAPQASTQAVGDAPAAAAANGYKLNAKKSGSATITIAAQDGAGATMSFTVKVEVSVTAITLDQTALNGAPGKSATLTATVNPTDATYSAVTWSSSDEAVATVTPAGVVNFVADGTAVITAIADGIKAECNVTVATPSGIDGIEAADEEGAVEYYNILGIRVDASALTPGIYIRRQGTNTTKVIIK